MPTYLIHTKTGTKGPFTLRVILKGIEIGKIPAGTTLEEVESGRRLKAAEMDQSDSRQGETLSTPTADAAVQVDAVNSTAAEPTALRLVTPVTTHESGSRPAMRPTAISRTNPTSLDDPVRQRFGPGSIIILAALAVATVSLFLSWVDFAPHSLSGWQQKAWLFLLGFGYPTYGAASHKLKLAPAYISLALMVLGLIIYQQTKDMVLLAEGDIGVLAGENINVAGNGFYLYFLASIAAFIGVYRIEAETIKRLALPRLHWRVALGVALSILFPPAGFGLSIHNAIDSRKSNRGLGLSWFGICVSTVMMVVGVYAVIHFATGTNTPQGNRAQQATVGPKPDEQPPSGNEDQRVDEEPKAENKEPAKPLTVEEFIVWFDNDPVSAKKIAIGEKLLFEGYLHPSWDMDRYGVKRRHLYLVQSPSPTNEQLVKWDNANQLMTVELDVFDDKWDMIDPSRKVLVAGRLVQPRKLDKADWRFHD